MEGLLKYLDHSPRALALVNEGKIAWANDALANLIATAVDDLIGSPLPLAGEVSLDRLRHSHTDAAMIHSSGGLVEVAITSTAVGPESWVFEIAPADHENAKASGYFAKLQVLADNLPVGIFVSESGLRLAYVNASMADLCDVLPDEMLGTRWLRQFGAEEEQRVRDLALTALTGTPVKTIIQFVTCKGKSRHLDISILPVKARDGSLSFIGTAEDVSEIAARESRLTFEAEHDPLTGLGNRRRLETDLDGYLQALPPDLELAVAFCDIDDFKQINDSLGHLVGDRVLSEVADRFRKSRFRAYRYAGDEFVAICAHAGFSASEVEDELRALLGEPMVLGSAVLTVKISVGVAVAVHGESTETVLGRSDAAMYCAKRSGLSDEHRR